MLELFNDNIINFINTKLKQISNKYLKNINFFYSNFLNENNSIDSTNILNTN